MSGPGIEALRDWGRLYGPTAADEREAIPPGISRAADLARNLHDTYACDQLSAQLTGVQRSVSRLRAMLAREANPDART